MVALAGVVFNYALRRATTVVFGWHYLVGKVVATGRVLLVGYLLNPIWTLGGPQATEGRR